MRINGMNGVELAEALEQYKRLRRQHAVLEGRLSSTDYELFLVRDLLTTTSDDVFYDQLRDRETELMEDYDEQVAEFDVIHSEYTGAQHFVKQIVHEGMERPNDVVCQDGVAYFPVKSGDIAYCDEAELPAEADKIEMVRVGTFDFAALRCHVTCAVVEGLECFVTVDHPGNTQYAVPVCSVLFEGSRDMLDRLMAAKNSGKAVKPSGSEI